jgi:hypothetical protein
VRLSALLETANGGLIPVSPPATLARDPDVRAVVTTDLLDPSRYLAGGELVLTGLAWWRPNRPKRTREFVASLRAAGVSAVAAGEAALGAVPHDVVAACAAAALPLLRVPVDVSFASITELATRHMSGQRSGDLAAVLGRHRMLLAAATAATAHSAAESGLGEILSLVSDVLDMRCWVLSPTGRVIGGVPPLPEERERRVLARRYLRASRLPHLHARADGRTVSVFGPATQRCASLLLAVDDDYRGWAEERRLVAEELVALVALERDLAARRTDVERQLAAALARGAPADDVAAAMRFCELDPDARSVVVVGVGVCAGPVIEEALSDSSDRWAMGCAEDEVLALVGTEHPAGVLRLLQSTLDFVAPALDSRRLEIGVSDAVTGSDGVLGAVAEARAAARAGDPAAAHSVGGPDRLSSHGLLLAAVPVDLRRAYRARVLGPLLEHDRRHRTQLVRTLEAYLECSGSWARCAERMHLHVNTLRYRVERIESLTGRDLRRLEDQADLMLALRLPA